MKLLLLCFLVSFSIYDKANKGYVCSKFFPVVRKYNCKETCGLSEVCQGFTTEISHGCFSERKVVDRNQVDTIFKDPENPCLTYTCTKEGFITKVQECPEQSWCSKELRTYDDNGCCYTCKNDCQPVPVQMAISKNGCKGTMRMFMCKGHCKQMVSYSDKERQIKNHCSCCKETKYINKNDRLFCPGGRLEPYSYKLVASCRCIPCKDI